jgi:flagellar biosynthetic protein FlhB
VPYAAELPLALALLVLVVVGAQPGVAFVRGFRSFAGTAWSGQVSPTQLWSELPSLLQPLVLLLSAPALATLVLILAQRAPTLRSVPESADAGGRGRPAHGRVLHGLLTGLKALVLSASLFALVFDSLAGWRDTYTRSAAELLLISERVLPALLLRAAWVCVLLGGVELIVQQLVRLCRLRMTRRQQQDEQRELAGDPRLLSERRARAHSADLPARLSPQLAAAELAQLSAAAVLITGTACVVALEYSPELAVPRVWLSAQGPHALELLARAYSLELPIVSDDLLASALLRSPLKAAIPAEWHARVAQLLVSSAVPAAREAS